MYATVVDVERYNPQRAPFSSTTKPTASQVIGLILDAESQADNILFKVGYDVPIPTTATLAFDMVGMAVAQIAAALVEEVAPTSGPNDRRNHYQRMSSEAKRMLAAGELTGVDRRSDVRVRYSTAAASAFFSRDMSL